MIETEFIVKRNDNEHSSFEDFIHSIISFIQFSTGIVRTISKLFIVVYYS